MRPHRRGTSGTRQRAAVYIGNCGTHTYTGIIIIEPHTGDMEEETMSKYGRIITRRGVRSDCWLHKRRKADERILGRLGTKITADLYDTEVIELARAMSNFFSRFPNV